MNFRGKIIGRYLPDIIAEYCRWGHVCHHTVLRLYGSDEDVDLKPCAKKSVHFSISGRYGTDGNRSILHEVDINRHVFRPAYHCADARSP